MNAELQDRLSAIMPTALTGRVVRTAGLTTAVAGFPAPVGAVVEIERHSGAPLRGEVIGFQQDATLVYPLGDVTGIRPGSRVRLVRTSRTIEVGNELLGRVVDARGKVIDQKPEPVTTDRVPLDRKPPPSVERPRIDRTLSTGVRAID